VSLLGYQFSLGHEVPKPPYVNWTRGDRAHFRWRLDWQEVIREAIAEEDPWGLLCVAPDGDVMLRDVITPGSLWAATEAGNIYLVLAKEARD
jgi:hypothetical protein